MNLFHVDTFGSTVTRGDTPCSACNERPALVKGMCVRCYQRDRAARAKAHGVAPDAEQQKIDAMRAEFTSANYYPEWNRIHRPFSWERREAKIRIQLYFHRTGCTKRHLAELVGVYYLAVLRWPSTSAHYPTEEQAKRILSLIDENGRLARPPASS